MKKNDQIFTCGAACTFIDEANGLTQIDKAVSAFKGLVSKVAHHTPSHA